MLSPPSPPPLPPHQPLHRLSLAIQQTASDREGAHLQCSYPSIESDSTWCSRDWIGGAAFTPPAWMRSMSVS